MVEKCRSSILTSALAVALLSACLGQAKAPSTETKPCDTALDCSPGWLCVSGQCCQGCVNLDGSPGDGSPGDSSPGDNSPGDSSPGDSSPGDSAPGDSSPGDSSPGDSSPGDSSPGDSSPGDSSPVEVDPIPILLTNVQLLNIRQHTTTLVEDFSPRYHTEKSIFLDDACVTRSPEILGDSTACQSGCTDFIVCNCAYSCQCSNLDRASIYVSSVFSSIDLLQSWEAVPMPDGTKAFNIIATKPGIVPGIIEIGAHLDTYHGASWTPGADDDAAAVAAMLEIATVLASFPNRHTIRFIAYVGEEIGRLGSIHHTRAAAAAGEQILAGLMMDGLGWANLTEAEPRGFSYTNCTWIDEPSAALGSLYSVTQARYDLPIYVGVCPDGTGRSGDQQPYWAAGFPAVMSVGWLPYGFPYNHVCGDNLARLNYDNVFYATLLNLAVLVTLDRQP